MIIIIIIISVLPVRILQFFRDVVQIIPVR